MTTKREEMLLEIVDNIYRAMYKVSYPPADYDKLIKDFEDKIPTNTPYDKVELFAEPFYMDHEIEEKIATDILYKEMSKFKLKSHEKDMIKTAVWLGASPKFKSK